MGIVVNRQAVENAAFGGEEIVGAVYDGKVVWQSAVNRIRFEPSSVSMSNGETQRYDDFAVKSVGHWEIEELL